MRGDVRGARRRGGREDEGGRRDATAQGVRGGARGGGARVTPRGSERAGGGRGRGDASAQGVRARDAACARAVGAADATAANARDRRGRTPMEVATTEETRAIAAALFVPEAGVGED